MSRKRKRYPKEVIDCPACKGSGIDYDGEPFDGIINGEQMMIYPDCPDCNGTGKQEREYEPEYEPEDDERDGIR